ncbi:MAG: ATP-binding cassette domain-containing protein [Actinobacteria bacterium]|nr:ATP-binding cassette domain-containing protein [Actinomycetota bacterium]
MAAPAPLPNNRDTYWLRCLLFLPWEYLAVLKVNNLCVSYTDQQIVSGLSFEVPTATTLTITGPSGAGKSTVLKAICGLVRTSSGSVFIDNRDITQLPTHRRGIGLVTQTNDLFPHLTVAQNIAFGLRMNGASNREMSDRVREMLNVVGLANFADRDINSLSGGEARRIALARSLAPSPKILLLDEPFTGLDDEIRISLMHQTKAILASSSMTSILVTHDHSEAEFFSTSALSLPPPVEPSL